MATLIPQLVISVLLLVFGNHVTTAITCDISTNAMFKEGNLGESYLFSWLGILRIHLHEGGITKIALTGAVLIKVNYVIVNADDVSRIPMHILTKDTRVMFIPTENKPWFCNVKSYTAHPEYEYATYNTIALVELALDDVESYPVKPICLPRQLINTGSNLYTAGYTDDNKHLEKIIYKMQYVDKPTCEEFYDKAGLAMSNRVPVHYQCGFALSEKENCVWDNGMALISNATGWFTLIGLGIRGPGCASPGRFIDIHEYIQWIDQQTTFSEMYDDVGYRRKEEPQFVPAHDLFRAGKVSNTQTKNTFSEYNIPVKKMIHFNLKLIEKDAVQITPFYDKLAVTTEGCSKPKLLQYHEHFKILTPPNQIAHVTYKVTLYDLFIYRCTCVKLKIDSVNRTKATFYFREIINFAEGRSLETPDEVIRHYIPQPGKQFNPRHGTWQPFPDMKPVYLKDDLAEEKIPNVALLVEFNFEGEAIAKVEFYGTAEDERYTDNTHINNERGVIDYNDYEGSIVTEPYIRKSYRNKLPKRLRQNMRKGNDKTKVNPQIKSTLRYMKMSSDCSCVCLYDVVLDFCLFLVFN